MQRADGGASPRYHHSGANWRSPDRYPTPHEIQVSAAEAARVVRNAPTAQGAADALARMAETWSFRKFGALPAG